MSWPGALAIVVLLHAPLLQAQRLLVDVKDSSAQRTVAGAVVTAAERATGATVHGLSDSVGRASLELPFAGVWNVSARRIGIVAGSAAPVRVDSGATTSIALTMGPLRFTLPQARVAAGSGAGDVICGRTPSGDTRTAVLWEQVTLALRSSLLTRQEPASASAMVVQPFERELDASLHVTRERTLRRRTGFGRPFFMADPDSLAQLGYVRRARDGDLQFFAPDEAALLADAFSRTHCFEVPAKDTGPAAAELRFRPAPGQWQPDIAGTAFVDAESGELQRISFRFVNADEWFAGHPTDAGGQLDVTPFGIGRWIVAGWSIRVPVIVRTFRGAALLTGYRESGGKIVTDRNSDGRP